VVDTISGLALFDIDGTLLRAGTDVHRAAFTHMYAEVYGLEASLDGINAAGRTDTWLLFQPLLRENLAVEQIQARLPAAFRSMCEFVDRHLGDLSHCVLPGVHETLTTLHESGILLGLITGNLERIAHAKMRKAGLDRYFDTGGFGEESATRSDLVPVAMRTAGARANGRLSPSQVMVIGDTPLDVEAGKAHGTSTVAVATGTVDFRTLAASGADLVLHSLEAPAAARMLDLFRLSSTSRQRS
jgi:phosphoglycolate phosphatase